MTTASEDSTMEPTPTAAESRNQWDADLYDRRHAFVWQQGAALLDLLQPRPGERILDVGCGTGHLTAQLAATGADVVGIDRSPAMIEQARRSYPQLRLEVADARDFAFAEPFDAVFSNAALHWVTEPERVIARVRAALKPGGRFVAEFGGRGNVRTVVASLVDAAAAFGCGPWANPWYFPGVGEYASLLERGGLEVTYAALFDRWTPLEGEHGLRNWVAMFANDLLAGVGPERREAFLEHVEARARPVLYRNGTWHADYRRLRVVAFRMDG
jgi:trans-aconitate methyltransferase